MKKKCIKIWLVVYRIRNICYNVYVNKRRGDDILETLQEKLEKFSQEILEEISLDVIKQEENKNNLTDKTILVHGHIKPKFNITRSYREKLNDK